MSSDKYSSTKPRTKSHKKITPQSKKSVLGEKLPLTLQLGVIWVRDSQKIPHFKVYHVRNSQITPHFEVYHVRNSQITPHSGVYWVRNSPITPPVWSVPGKKLPHSFPSLECTS